MEKIEEIEEFLKKETENIEREFLNGLKAKKNIPELENSYRIKIKKLRGDYEKKVNKYLEEQKSISFKLDQIKKNKKPTKENFKTFEVKKFDFKLSFKERMKIKWEIFKFKYIIKKKKFTSKITPKSFTILRLKYKLWKKNLKNSFSNYITRTNNNILKFFQKLLEKIKEGWLKIKEFFLKIIKKITFKKTEKKEEKPKENEEVSV